MKLIVGKSGVAGKVQIPGSKSHTIRAVVIASLAEGRSVIRKPLGREAARLGEISVIWDEREDQIFRIIDSAHGRGHLAVVEPPPIDEPVFELTPAALAYLEAHRDAG